ncbi:MAG TPA: sigma 54-interacting transcriptional regulator [Atribacterota bacterium]|nr:sigma 54-interacting transcriptional regulator [Atribacterota bacterium]
MRRYLEQILNIYNYIDGLIVTNNKGIAECFKTFRPDINKLKEEDVIGKHILEIYPDLTWETSSILRVLRDGKPIFNEMQHLKTYKGQSIYAVNTTMPIISGDKIIGAVDVSKYLDPGAQRQNIVLSLKDNNLTKGKNDLYCIDDIITAENSMMDIKDKILKISKTDSSVLVYGTTGTGKELVIQSIHRHSERSDKPFVSQSCAAIPSTLLESILFGTVKGSYTGAENKKGLFEVAQGGTVFLDEINSMEINIQAKILKAIEEKKIRRVGGIEPIDIDIRIVSAVNEEPWKAIKEGRLREDLFYRLSVAQINIPNLKERKKDIKLLTDYFIGKFNKNMNRAIIGVDEKVEDIFNNYSWPGNVRELKNVIEGAFNLTIGNLIQKKDLPDYIQNKSMHTEENIEEVLGKTTLNDLVKDYEKKIIETALKKSSNMAKAAKLLKISKQLLKYKIVKYKL